MSAQFLCDRCGEPVHCDGVRLRIEAASTTPTLFQWRYRSDRTDLCRACAQVAHDALWPPRSAVALPAAIHRRLEGHQP
jgi:hypothetical protein